MILAASHIDKYFADQCILKNATFHINEQERVAIVGSNGAGKTTLLRILVKELGSDSGTVIMGKDITFGYLPQQQAYHSKNTIFSELLTVKEDILTLDREIRLMEQNMKHQTGLELEHALKKYSNLQEEFEKKEGYAYKSQVMGIINGLGFVGDDIEKPINSLSGGQKTRVALGKLLLMKPDLLILDEPTNHLDLDSTRWLETYLSNTSGSVLIVSHDRFFLDRITNKIIEIDAGRVTTFIGNYSEYSKKKEDLRAAIWNQYINQQKEIKHQEEVIEKLRSFNREKSIKRAESRVKLLDKMERLDKPTSENRSIHFTLTPSKISGNDVLSINNLSKKFDTLTLFHNISFDMKRGETVALLGKNGTGKTTLLKMIAGLIPIKSGDFHLGANVYLGYYDQEHQVLSDEKTIFEEIQDAYPNLDHTKIRNVLATFLFTGDDVYKTIKLLSGGEKGRVSLAKLMLSEANFLLLDEPTNHLDIASKEILENAINHYSGTVLYVSHDRYFINKTATRILDLTGQMLLSYDGNYSYYEEKRDMMEALHLERQYSEQTAREESEAKTDWKQKKAEQSNRRKLENELIKWENLITELEEKITKLDCEISLDENARDASKCIELTANKGDFEEQLLVAMENWERLGIELGGE